MGRRIRNLRRLIRELRNLKPKYSFEHAVANILLSLTLPFLPGSGGSKLWWLIIAVLLASIGVQYFRVNRLMHRQDREREARLRRAMEDDADA